MKLNFKLIIGVAFIFAMVTIYQTYSHTSSLESLLGKYTIN